MKNIFRKKKNRALKEKEQAFNLSFKSAYTSKLKRNIGIISIGFCLFMSFSIISYYQTAIEDIDLLYALRFDDF